MCVCVCVCVELMVGPDSVVTSSGAAVADDDLLRRRNHDDDDTTTVTCSESSEVDMIQLLARRLTVTPPTDDASSPCSIRLQRPQMTANTSTEVPIHFLSLSTFDLHPGFFP